MELLVLDQVLTQLRAALEHDDLARAAAVLESLRPADQADLVADLKDVHQVALLSHLHPANSADILEKMEDEDAAGLVLTMSTDAVIRIVDQMAPDKAADLLGDIPPEQAGVVLQGMVDPDEVRPLLLHSDDSVGGLMTSEFLVLRPKMTAAEARQAVRGWKEDAEAIYYLFVVDRQGKLVGVVNLQQLLAADSATCVANMMDPAVISVRVGADQEACARLMARYDLLSLPVVDEANHLLGVVTIDDVVDVLEDEATEDIQRFGGAEPLEQSYLNASAALVIRKRVGWLMLLFVTESLTGSVLRHFENELQTVVSLAFFVPLLIGTGGNAGTQTTSTIIRALAIGDIDLSDALRALWHELRVGLGLGVGMATVAYGRALMWGTSQQLALTVSLAIFTIVVWANGLGAVLPLLAARLRIDPTVVSGPVMSTLVDATGLFIYFSIARGVLGL